MKEYFKKLNKTTNIYLDLILSIVIASGLAIIDYFDLISKIFYLFLQPYFVVLFVAALLIVILGILYVRPFSQLKIRSITSLDLFFIRIELGFLFYLILSILLCSCNWLKTGLLVGLIVCIFIFILVRFIFFIKALKCVVNNETRIIDLKKVFENCFPEDNSLPVFIDEKDVDYDLLDRQSIINKLVSSIKNYNTEGSYVIGLAGHWGSGKTTVINNAKAIIKKESKKTIIIDEFDPWLYENQEALLVAMVETIMKEAGIKYSYKNLKKVCNIIKEVIGLTKDGEKFSKAFSLIAHKDSSYVETIKDKINDFLTLNDKYVVVIIDNIERATAENVIFLFKLIGTLFDLKRITYILSYDKERLDTIFKDVNKIDCHYIEKIIQQEIAVPTIQNSKRSEIYSACFCNMLEYYGVNQSDIPSFNFIFEFLKNEIKDLRTFKRLINSTFAVVFTEDNYLYKPDLLALEIIRFYDSELYYTIHKNRKFFISHDTILEGQLYVSFRKEKYNQEGKEFFTKMLSARSDGIKNLLSIIFPYVNRFLKNDDLIPKDYFGDPQYSTIQTNGRVCSAKFFDLYFCYGANEYLAIKEDVNEFVDICNSKTQLTDQLLSERLLKINYDFQEEWFSILQFHLSEIKEDNLLVIIKFLTNNIDSLDDAGVFLSVNALQRVTYIIFNVLKSCSDANFNSYLQFIDKSYNRLLLLEHLYSHFDKAIDKGKFDAKLQKLKQSYENMCEDIITKNINIYDSDNYRIKSIWALARYLKKHTELISLQDYIANVLNEKTIFRLLGDIITESISNTYNYYISEESYALLFGAKDIGELVTTTEAITDSQKFVKEIYWNYINGTENEFGEKVLSYLQPVRYRL